MTESEQDQAYNKRKWFALFSLIGSLSIIFIDQTALPLALPTLQRQFELSFSQLQWIVNAYLLTLATFILAAGSMGDLFGHRRVFSIGLIIFTLASLNCSLASSATWLIVNRAIQGIGGALMIPTTLALLHHAFPSHELGKALGIYGSFVALSLAVGPIIGGYFTEFYSWTLIFWINIPIGLITLPLVLIFNKKLKGSRQPIDWYGFLTVSLFITSLILAIMQGQEWGWNSFPIIGLFILSFFALILFVIGESKIPHPLIDFNLLKNKIFLNNNAVVFCYQFISTVVVFWSLYFQNGLSFSPTKAGLLLLISNIPLLIITPLAGILSDKIGAKKLISSGGLILTICFLLFMLYANHMSLWLLIILLLSFRCGTSLILIPVFSYTLKTVPLSQQGQASGLLTTSRQMGSTFCIAIGSAGLDYFYQFKFAHFFHHNPSIDPHLKINQLQGILSGAPSALETLKNFPPDISHQILLVAHDAFTFSFSILCLLFALISFFIFLLSKNLP